MPLDPKIEKILKNMQQAGPMSSMSIEEARMGAELMTRMDPTPRTQVGPISDRAIPGPGGDLPVRIYRPEGNGPFPVVVYFHGGGFIVGSLDTHDPVCRDICAGACALVVSVEYRRAPENRFPSQVEDALAATRWVGEHAAELDGDANRIVIAGDSAGANLSTVISMRVRDEGGPRLCGQVLIYPVTDMAAIETESRREMGDKGYFMTLEDMEWMTRQYVKEESDMANPWCSPRRAKDLSGLPPAFILTAEYDPLRDEGEQYGQMLEKAGVPVKVKRYEGVIHVFIQLPGVRQASIAKEDICNWLKEVFS